jgi:hypothetical protein
MVFDRPFDSLNWEAWPYGQGKPVSMYEVQP